MQTSYLLPLEPFIQKSPSPYRLKDLPASERPRERLSSLGPQALSGAELLAVLLGSGTVQENAVQLGTRLLLAFNGLHGLRRASFDELLAQHGVGLAKAAQLQAAVELGRRLTLEASEDPPCIHSPADAAALVQYEMSAFAQEHLRIIFLNTRSRVIGMEDLYRGSLDQAQVRVGEVFKTAIRKNTAAIILIHNHPSSDPSPSMDDLALTRAIIQAGKLMDIDVIDHLIIGQGPGRYLSMRESNLAFGT